MTAPAITAAYIPGLALPAVCVNHQTHTLAIPDAKALLGDLALAIEQAELAARTRTRAPHLGTPDDEMDRLMQMVNLRLAEPETFPKSSPASEVTP